MFRVRDQLKGVPGLVKVVRSGRKLYRNWRTSYLLSRYPDGGYLMCGDSEVFCDFRYPTYVWYDGLSRNLAMGQKIIRTIFHQNGVRGNVLFDIGAHNGFFTAYLSRISEMGGIANAKVIALEPDRQYFLCLQKTAARCMKTSITLVQVALAANDGSATMYQTRDDCLHTYLTDGAKTAYSVRARSLDSLAAEYLQDDDSIAFIKIDIDGAEPALFTGGEKTLATHRPVIMMEFAPGHLRQAGVDAESFFSQMCDSYLVHWVCYLDYTIKKVDRCDYPEIQRTLSDAIADLVLSKTPLDFSELGC
jgi:FkbM family methyltransferase